MNEANRPTSAENKALKIVVTVRKDDASTGDYAVETLKRLALEGKPSGVSYLAEIGSSISTEVVGRRVGAVDVLIIPEMSFISRSHPACGKFLKSAVQNGIRVR